MTSDTAVKNWRHQQIEDCVHQDKAPSEGPGCGAYLRTHCSRLAKDSVAISTPGSAPMAGAHLFEAIVDPGTLVRSNCDFWEVDRNGREIQHVHLILNPEE